MLALDKLGSSGKPGTLNPKPFNSYIGDYLVYWGYIGIMEKKMETRNVLIFLYYQSFNPESRLCLLLYYSFFHMRLETVQSRS